VSGQYTSPPDREDTFVCQVTIVVPLLALEDAGSIG
jgi:hypothetical protein